MSNRWFGRTGARPAPPAVVTPPPAPGPAGENPLVTIDALGRKCPIPIIMLAQRIGEVPVGSLIAVLADDPAAETDVPAWCMMKSHDHVLTRPLERGWAITIRRGY
ncbi:MAG TPA: sulfurtransferase TusA family protein [Streptosporangiaceae bacterium]